MKQSEAPCSLATRQAAVTRPCACFCLHVQEVSVCCCMWFCAIVCVCTTTWLQCLPEQCFTWRSCDSKVLNHLGPWIIGIWNQLWFALGFLITARLVGKRQACTQHQHQQSKSHVQLRVFCGFGGNFVIPMMSSSHDLSLPLSGCPRVIDFALTNRIMICHDRVCDYKIDLDLRVNLS